MANVTYKEKFTPLSPMSAFLRVLSIFGGFPLTPVSDGNLYNERKLSSDYNGRRSPTSSSRNLIDDNNSWDNIYAFEVLTLRLIWCVISNALPWVLLLTTFFIISYGNDYSGIEYLFPLNVSSR